MLLLFWQGSMSGYSRNVCIPDLPNLFQFGKQHLRIGETHSQRGMYHTVSYDYRDGLLQGSIHVLPVLREKVPYTAVLHSPGGVPEGENQSPRNLCIRNRYDLLGLQEGGGSGVSFLLYYCMIAKLQHFYNASVTRLSTAPYIEKTSVWKVLLVAVVWKLAPLLLVHHTHHTTFTFTSSLTIHRKENLNDMAVDTAQRNTTCSFVYYRSFRVLCTSLCCPTVRVRWKTDFPWFHITSVTWVQ